MWLIKINPITNFLAFVIGFIFYRRFPKEIKTVFYFVAFGAFTEIFGRFYQHFITKNVMPIGHFYFPVAYLIAGIFYVQILKGFIKPVYLWTLIIVLEVYCVINSVFIQGLFEYASIVGALGAMLIFLFSVAFFTRVMVEAKIINLAEYPLIWINSAFLIYYAGNFFYHSFYNIRSKGSIDILITVAKLFSVLNILFYLLLLIGFILAVRKKSHISG
jgi:hypothetical protein